MAWRIEVTLAYLANLAWLLSLVGAFIAFQLWQLRQIERETPPREKTPDAR